jgi:hypothetical protein
MNDFKRAQKVRNEANAVGNAVVKAAADFFLTDLDLSFTLARLARQSYDRGDTLNGDRQKAEARTAFGAVQKLVSKVNLDAAQQAEIEGRLQELDSKLQDLESHSGPNPS